MGGEGIKIAVVSDTHVQTPADLPQRFLDGVKGADLLLHAGDMLNLDVLERLKKLVPEVKAVWGNMDPAEVKQALPEKEIIQIKQFRIGLTHGSGAPLKIMETVKEKFKNEQVDCIVYGHSHSPQNKVQNGILYFNPGSPTDKVFAPYNSYGIFSRDWAENWEGTVPQGNSRCLREKSLKN
jgi:putative phosphoesterase